MGFTVPNFYTGFAYAIVTACGAVCGASTVGSYVEASAGSAEGGKNGFVCYGNRGIVFH